jgi:hypothetical protein
VGANPVDGGKPGSKLQLVCDGGGLPLAAAVTAANVADVTMLQAMVGDIPPVRTPSGRRRHRPGRVDADKGYDSAGNRGWLRRRGIGARIARRGIESSTRLGQHRWRVERALSWLSCYRRLAVRWDRRDAPLSTRNRPRRAIHQGVSWLVTRGVGGCGRMVTDLAKLVVGRGTKHRRDRHRARGVRYGHGESGPLVPRWRPSARPARRSIPGLPAHLRAPPPASASSTGGWPCWCATAARWPLGGPRRRSDHGAHSQARADRDAKLTQFLICEAFQPEQVEAVMFNSDGRLWRVEVGLAAEEPDDEGERFAGRVDHAVWELEALLQLEGSHEQEQTLTITNDGSRQADPQQQPLGSHACLDPWAPRPK